MVIPRDAIAIEDWELLQKGLPVPKKKVKPRPDPSPPVVENELKFTDIPDGEIRDIFARLHRPAVRNESGVVFTGYDVEVVIDQQTYSGWMGEGDFLKLKMKIPLKRVDLLQKCGW